jgi:hypothetical protein
MSYLIVWLCSCTSCILSLCETRVLVLVLRAQLSTATLQAAEHNIKQPVKGDNKHKILAHRSGVYYSALLKL